MVRARAISRHLPLALAFGALLRLLILSSPGSADVPLWRVWSDAASQDLGSAYAPEAVLFMTYPPGAAYELAAVGRFYRAVAPDFVPSRLFNALVKITGVAMESLALGALLVVARRRHAAWAGPAERIWLDPSMILSGAALGYFDPQMTALALLSWLAMDAGRPVTAGLVAAAALCLKPQGVLLLPALVLAAQPSGWRALARAGAACAAGAAVILTPFAVRGLLPNVYHGVASLVGGPLSADAFNAWWLVTWALEGLQRTQVAMFAQVDAMTLGWPHPGWIGGALFATAVAWGVSRLRTSASDVRPALAAPWTFHVWTAVVTGVHENHLVAAVPFRWMATAAHPRYRGLAALVSLVATANLLLIYGIGEAWHDATPLVRIVIAAVATGLGALSVRHARDLPTWLRWSLGTIALWSMARLLARPPASLLDLRLAPGLDASVLVAAVNVGALAWHAVELRRAAVSPRS